MQSITNSVAEIDLATDQFLGEEPQSHTYEDQEYANGKKHI